MSRINMTINLTVGFDTLEEARFIGQAVERIVGEGAENSIKLYEVPGLHSIPLHQPKFDASKVTRTYPDVEAKASALVKFIEVHANEGEPADVFWADFIETARLTGELDYVTLEALVASRTGAPDTAVTAIITEAYGKVAEAEAKRALSQITAARNAAAKRAASQQNGKKK
jgi:hypothetical protein